MPRPRPWLPPVTTATRPASENISPPLTCSRPPPYTRSPKRRIVRHRGGAMAADGIDERHDGELEALLSKGLTRRDVLRGAVVGGAALSLPAALAPAAAAAEPK